MNNLLLENNPSHSRKLFFGCVFIALALVPVVLDFVDRSMSAHHPKQSQPEQDSSAATWDMRSK
jgi:hypothetical protein